MQSIGNLEQQILGLSSAERRHIALTLWESLEDDPAVVDSPDFDPEGIKLATERDQEIESGAVRAIDHTEFRRLTNDPSR